MAICPLCNHDVYFMVKVKIIKGNLEYEENVCVNCKDDLDYQAWKKKVLK